MIQAKNRSCGCWDPVIFWGIGLVQPGPPGRFWGGLGSRPNVCDQGARLRQLMTKYLLLALKILEELSQSLQKTEQLLEDISLHLAERRLAQILLTLGAKKDTVEPGMAKES